MVEAFIPSTRNNVYRVTEKIKRRVFTGKVLKIRVNRATCTWRRMAGGENEKRHKESSYMKQDEGQETCR